MNDDIERIITSFIGNRRSYLSFDKSYIFKIDVKDARYDMIRKIQKSTYDLIKQRHYVYFNTFVLVIEINDYSKGYTLSRNQWTWIMIFDIIDDDE